MKENQTTEQHSKKNIVFSVSTVVFAALVLFFYIVSNLPAITGWVSNIFKIFSPVITGFAIAYIVNPVLRILERKVLRNVRASSVRRMLAIILSFLIVVLIIGAIGLLIIPQLLNSLQELFDKFDTYINNAVSYINNIANKIQQYLPFTKDNDANPDNDLISLEKVTQFLQSLIAKTDDLAESIFSYIQSYASKLLSTVSDLVLALFISFYVLASKERILAQCRRIGAALFSEERHAQIRKTIQLADSTFGSFLGGKIVDCVVVGIIVYIFFLIFRVPYAAMIATIIGATNIIPFFGPIIGALPAGFIVFISDPSKLLAFIIIDLVVLQIDGNIIEPKIIGDRTGISSLCVLISISVMGNLWGVIGMIVGVPLFAVITALIEEYVTSRLNKRGISSDIDDYYADEPIETPQSIPKEISYTSPQYYLDSIRYLLTPKKKRKAAPNRANYHVTKVIKGKSQPDISVIDAIDTNETIPSDLQEATVTEKAEAEVQAETSAEDEIKQSALQQAIQTPDADPISDSSDELIDTAATEERSSVSAPASPDRREKPKSHIWKKNQKTNE